MFADVAADVSHYPYDNRAAKKKTYRNCCPPITYLQVAAAAAAAATNTDALVTTRIDDVTLTRRPRVTSKDQ